MKGVMRMLMMFGPMIFRQIQKYRRNKSSQKASQNTAGQVGRAGAPNDTAK